MEQEGLGADEEIRNEPNERETERLLAFAPERPAAYEKFRVGRNRQQPKRWIIPAQITLKVSFWLLGMWGHRAWKYVAHTLLVIVFVFLIITWAYSCDPSQLCSIYCNYTAELYNWDRNEEFLLLPLQICIRCQLYISYCFFFIMSGFHGLLHSR